MKSNRPSKSIWWVSFWSPQTSALRSYGRPLRFWTSGMRARAFALFLYAFAGAVVRGADSHEQLVMTSNWFPSARQLFHNRIGEGLPVIRAQFHDASPQQLWRVTSARCRLFGKVSSLICVSIASDLKTGLARKPKCKKPLQPLTRSSRQWQFRPFRLKVVCKAA